MDAIPTVINASSCLTTLDGSKVQYEDTVLYTCDVGHILPNNNTQYTIMCNASGTWDLHPKSCERKS